MVVLALAGCATLVPRLQPPEVRGTDVEFVQLALPHAWLVLGVRLYNPNAVAIDLAGLDTSLRIEGAAVGDSRLAQPVTLAPQAETRVALDVRADVAMVLSLLAPAIGSGRTAVSYELSGVAVLGDGRRFPFTRRGTSGALKGKTR